MFEVYCVPMLCAFTGEFPLTYPDWSKPVWENASNAGGTPSKREEKDHLNQALYKS